MGPSHWNQALRLLVAHVRVPLAEAQAHHAVVHVVLNLLAVEAPGEALAHGEQLIQVLFPRRCGAAACQCPGHKEGRC